MSSGQRLEEHMMIPLSTEKLSFGNPSITQSRIVTGLPRTVANLNAGELGIFLLKQMALQSVSSFSL